MSDVMNELERLSFMVTPMLKAVDIDEVAPIIKGLQSDIARRELAANNLVLLAEDLQSQLDAMKAEQWVSVEDRLPPRSWVDIDGVQYVLVCFDSGHVITDYIDDDGEWNDARYARGSKVTHWMPLPSPPESK